MRIFYLTLYAKRVQIGNCYCNKSTNMAALLSLGPTSAGGSILLL
ncbi:hypothetical protein PGS_00016980 [Porphyromonas gingivalis A7A1-28]|nr:hypothetical protein PGS_00016980 [Porphyromonas gingivalis A7A1-28]